MSEEKSSGLSPVMLFSSWRSSCSYRVRICLNFKGIKHEIKPVNLMTLADPNAEYQMNPMNYLPALQIDGHTLIESLAILQYVEETRPQPPLLPKDFHKRAEVRAICDIIAAGIQPLQNIGVLNHMGHYMGEKERQWAEHWIIKGFTAVEKILVETAGKFCAGDEISFADCCLVPQVFNARRNHVDLSPFPIIVRIDRDLHNHPAFRRAHPFLQEDFPGEMLTDDNFFQAKL